MANPVVSLPTPTGGWNTRDPFDRMAPEDAIQLDNFFPDTGYCQLRKGHTEHCATGETDPIGTLFSYTGNGASTLLAAVAGEIIDVTTSTPSSLATGYTIDVWSWTNHSAGGTPRLIAANASGTDVPWVYDGATVAPVVVTGVTDTSLSQVLLHAQRVFYVERASLSVWYTTAGAFQGALTEFDFGPFCRKGGTINAIGSWTRDNGAGGADDLFVVVTTEGEVLLYAGTDPAAGIWELQGVFAVGKPVPGSRCLVKTGPDLVLICADGFQPLSEYLMYGSTRAVDTSLAKKIANAAQAAVAEFGALAGWQGILYGEGSMLIINVPQTADTVYQYVVNTTTGAWCRFLGQDAFCWATLGGDLYFGADGGLVCQAWNGPADVTSDIVGEMITSYQYVGGQGAQKRFTMARPIVQTNGPIEYALGVSVDYSTLSTLPTVSSNAPAGALWDTGVWGTAVWSTETFTVQKNWAGVSGIGYSVAVQIKVSTQTISMRINSFDLMYERGWAI